MAQFCRHFLIPFYVLMFSSPLLAENVTIETKPIDTVELTCDEFKQKIEKCESYTCQTPYYRDPTIKMEWNISEQKNNRCVISYTTYDLGLKDDEDNPMPITQTCQYDEDGIKTLIEFIEDIEKGYFHPIIGDDNSNNQGIYNCTFTSKGKPITGAYSKPSSEK